MNRLNKVCFNVFCDWSRKLALVTLNKRNAILDPLHPTISMHILNTVPYTFPGLLKRRMRLYIESLFSRWSFPLFSWRSCLIKGWYCEEKSNARHSLGLRVKPTVTGSLRFPAFQKVFWYLLWLIVILKFLLIGLCTTLVLFWRRPIRMRSKQNDREQAIQFTSFAPLLLPSLFVFSNAKQFHPN